MIIFFKGKNNKTRKKYRKYKTKTRILKSFDSFVIVATISSSFTLSLPGIGLIATAKLASTICGLSIGNKLLYELIISKNNGYKKQYEKDQQTINSIDKLCRKPLQDNIIDKIEYKFYVKFLLDFWMKRKLNL